MKIINLFEIYSRYSSWEIIFKYITSKLLSFHVTKALSILLLKRLFSRPHGAVFKIVNKIYFCGESLPAAQTIADSLAMLGISSVLDYAVEGLDDEIEFDKALENTLHLIEISSCCGNIPFVVIKPSSIGSTHTYQIRSNDNVSDAFNDLKWKRIEERYKRIFDTALHYRVKVMVDAEHSSIQHAVNPFIINLMRLYNTKWPVITLTLQFYLKCQMDRLNDYYQLASRQNFKLGIKVVRGAYLETEKSSGGGFQRCFPSKIETDASYNEAIEYISHRLDVIYPFFATHNEISLKLIMQNERLNAAHVWTGQLYGIGDHITISLQAMNFKVCKYLPFGPIDKSVPYLLRRIEENAVSPETFKKEAILLRRELWRRFTRGGQACA